MYDVAVYGEMTAIFKGKPTWIRHRQLLDISLIAFMICRGFCLIICLSNDSLWHYYIQLDRLVELLFVEQYYDFIGVSISLSFAIYVFYIYYQLFFVRPFNQIGLSILHDLINRVYHENKESQHFPEVPQHMICKKFRKSLQFFTFSRIGMHIALCKF